MCPRDKRARVGVPWRAQEPVGVCEIDAVGTLRDALVGEAPSAYRALLVLGRAEPFVRPQIAESPKAVVQPLAIWIDRTEQGVVHGVVPKGHRDAGIDGLESTLEEGREARMHREETHAVVRVVALAVARLVEMGRDEDVQFEIGLPESASALCPAHRR